jgi:hypothetical protein
MAGSGRGVFLLEQPQDKDSLFLKHSLFWKRRLASEAEGVVLSLSSSRDSRKGAQSAISLKVVPTLLGV